MFEGVGALLHWPKEVWPLLLLCKLVKNATLCEYELVPEAHRQCFCKQQQTANQTFVEFTRDKATLFDEWCAVNKISDFSALHELVLSPKQIVVYLNEQKVSTLKEAAVVADEFALTPSIWNLSEIFFHTRKPEDE